MMLSNKSEISSAYLTTSAVAKILSISVGTVQKLVSGGKLLGYITAGGHRRISARGLVDYCKKNKIPLQSFGIDNISSGEANGICVLFAKELVSPNIPEIIANGSFFVISEPMNLLRVAHEFTHIFIDARIEWIDWLKTDHLINDGVHHIVYNARILEADVRKHVEKMATVIDIDVSIELLQGYRLGLQAPLHVKNTLFSGVIRH